VIPAICFSPDPFLPAGLYGPQQALFAKTWKLPDIEKVE
jgi:hypothetical protein